MDKDRLAKSHPENHHHGRLYLVWEDSGLKLPPSIQIKRVQSKCDINAGEVLMSLFFFFRFGKGQNERGQPKQNKYSMLYLLDSYDEPLYFEEIEEAAKCVSDIVGHPVNQASKQLMRPSTTTWPITKTTIPGTALTNSSKTDKAN